jgi:enoyl-CoA hydratase
MNPRRARSNRPDKRDKREKPKMPVPEPTGSVDIIEINLGSANAINQAFLDYLNERLDALDSSENEAAIITGYDSFFSAGLDLVGLFDMDRSAMEGFMKKFGDTFMRLFTFRKPIVAAINGHAIAGGCVLALACDYRVMGRGSALIGLNEVKLGIALPSMVIEFARAVVQPKAYPQVLYMGETFQPQTALALQLIDELVEPTAVRRRAIDVATQLARGGAAFSQIKRDLRASIVEKLSSKDNSAEWLDLWFSPDTRERLKAIRQSLMNKNAQKVAKTAEPEKGETPPGEASEPTGSDHIDQNIQDQVDQSDEANKVGKIAVEEASELLERVSDEE